MQGVILLQKRLKDILLESVRGNIARQEGIAAVVNAANPDLMPGAGVAGAIHQQAGPELYQECKPLAPIRPGEAVITRAYNLPNSYVIHCLGPVYGTDKPEETLLGNCYRNALWLAEQYQLESIAFPAVSTGIYGYPVKQAAEIAVGIVVSMLSELKSVKHIRFVLFSEADLTVYNEILKEF